MSEPSQAVPDLETRLAEMDRRLREIQAELAPDREPRAAPTPGGDWVEGLGSGTRGSVEEVGEEQPGPLRGRAGPLADVLARGPRRERDAAGQLEAMGAERELLGELYGRLLASVRELLDGYEAAASRMAAGYPGAPAPEGRAQDHGGVAGSKPHGGVDAEAMLSAGPLRSTGALRDFAQALSSLPGVREVAVRGYEGPDRAIVDVELSAENT